MDSWVTGWLVVLRVSSIFSPRVEECNTSACDETRSIASKLTIGHLQKHFHGDFAAKLLPYEETNLTEHDLT